MSTPMQYFYFLVYALSSYLIFLIELFYLAITTQILNRILKLEEILAKNGNSIAHQKQIFNLFKNISEAVKSVNGSLGISILMNFLKHFVKITTRVYMIFHIITYDGQKEVSSNY